MQCLLSQAISADSGVCDEQLPWGIQPCSHTPRRRGILPALSQHRIQGQPEWEDFTGVSEMGGADGLAELL